MDSWHEHGVTAAVLSPRGGISTGVLLSRGQKALLIDCGDGVGRDLDDRGVTASSLSGVIVTHDHGDHVGGLFGLFWWLRTKRRSEKLTIHGPRHAPTLRGIVALYRRVYRGRTRFAIRQRAMVHDRAFRAGPFEITSFPVRHRRSSSDPVGALMEVHALRIRAGEKTIVVSADTGPSERLEREAEGADLAIVEATYGHHTSHTPPETHLTRAEAEAIGRRARHFMLYHRTAT